MTFYQQANNKMNNRTNVDIELARVYFEILVDIAKNYRGRTIQYGELVLEAKRLHANNPIVRNAIPTNIGRRLDALRDFTSKNQLPDLSALVVSRSTGDNGIGFSRSFDGDSVRQQVFDFDWSVAKGNFETFLMDEKAALQLRQEKVRKIKKISEAEALDIWWDYCKNKGISGKNVSQADKVEVIKFIVSGESPEVAWKKLTE